VTLFALYLACCFITTVLIFYHNMVTIPERRRAGEYESEYTSRGTILLAVALSPIFLFLVAALIVVGLIARYR